MMIIIIIILIIIIIILVIIIIIIIFSCHGHRPTLRNNPVSIELLAPKLKDQNRHLVYRKSNQMQA